MSVQGQIETAKWDHDYSNSTVVLRVESTLFNVKRKWLEDQSTVFRDVFRMPQVDSSGEAEGSSAWNPIVLPCQAAEFKQLLDVINPKKRKAVELFARDQLESLLKLALLWEMKDIRDRAVKTLLCITEEDPLTQIHLGRTFNSEIMVTRGLFNLATRHASLSDSDVALLGWDTAIKLFHIREEYIRDTFSQASQTSDQSATSSTYNGSTNGRASFGVMRPHLDRRQTQIPMNVYHKLQADLGDFIKRQGHGVFLHSSL